MITFHGDPAIQAKYIARVKAHRLADELTRGIGYEPQGDGKVKACAVGCTLDAYDHSRYPVELGIPTELAHLEDFLFENLTEAEAMAWPERFLSAPRLGSDLRLVWDRFTLWILTEEHPDRGEHCARMGALFARRVAGDEPKAEEWARAARDARVAGAAWAAGAAWDATAGAAWDARVAWVARDARVARDAWDARAARDARVAWDASISRMADRLIALMAEAPVT